MVSLIQTAEGALNETHSILQRMRELAVQSGNDTNTDADRAEMQKEVDQLANALTDISKDTEFNTKKLLDGTFTDATFHVGANQGQNLKVSVNDMSASKLEVATDYTVGASGAISGLTYKAEADAIDYTIDASGNIETLSGTDLGTFDASGADGAGYYDTSGGLVLAADTALTAGDAGTIAATDAGYYNGGDLVIAADAKLTEGDKVTVGINISSQTAADAAITTINNAIETVSAERSKLGAVQNRLDHTINNLGTASENLTAAESRIRDVDYDLAAA